MLSYDWTVMITLGLGRWASQRRPLARHEVELEAARQRHAARMAAEPPPPRSGFWHRLISRRHLPGPLRLLRRGPLRRPASRA